MLASQDARCNGAKIAVFTAVEGQAFNLPRRAVGPAFQGRRTGL